MIKAVLVDAGGVLFLNKGGIGYINQPLVDFIKENRTNFKFGIVSTTNYDLDEILEKDGIKTLFDVVITSGKTGLDKSKKEIYKLALAKLSIQPEEAIFIDNEQRYIDAAKKLGINTVFYTKDKSIYEYLK